ncbi:caspase family protein [Myxococcus qinghaiensis]|uniref:caspase family protein n=1 Tax=Myxococcus qinghaiensis TaxID=2906758 RepID=UPI0020A7423C|nr:caspase family protein [Myxococcus qinghaiensis]MCP3168720.1 caspase family protein [Myxococcus qinghaiensis]
MTSIRCFLLALLVCATSPAEAGTRRIAVLVGHNVGSGERPPLRYAEADAVKLAGVLSELGDVPTSDLMVLQGQDLTTVRAALDAATKKVDSLRGLPDTRVVLLFYFSGHSDGVALELGTERLLYADLRRWLDATHADVRLAIVDSCRSGALLRFKGGRPGPSFELRLTDEVHSTGHALLTSSAEDELALESREVGGSLFTHHLVSGLRGAADASGDGLVTLAEAYQYAYAHTVSATADVLTGAQHPAYDYRLTGKGELILTQLPSPGTALELPNDFERALLLRPGRGQVLAELGPGAVPRLAVPPGDYELRAWRAGKQHQATLRAPAGQVLKVRWEDLQPVAPASSVGGTKGGEDPAPRTAVSASPEEWNWPESPSETPVKPRQTSGAQSDKKVPPEEPRPWETATLRRAMEEAAAMALVTPVSTPEPAAALAAEQPVLEQALPPPPLPMSRPPGPSGPREVSLAVGVRHSALEVGGALLAFRLETTRAEASGMTFSLQMGQGPQEENREFITGFGVGYAWRKRSRIVEFAGGVEASLQLVVQSKSGNTGWTVGPAVAPMASISMYLMPELALSLGGRLPLAVLRVNDFSEVKFLPSLELGVKTRF